MNILCDDILELIGKEVYKIRNRIWWINNYGYHLSHDKFALDSINLRIKDINSFHAIKIAHQLVNYNKWKDSDLIPKFWPGILNYTLYNWHDNYERISYESIPSKRCILANSYMISKIQDHLDF